MINMKICYRYTHGTHSHACRALGTASFQFVLYRGANEGALHLWLPKLPSPSPPLILQLWPQLLCKPVRQVCTLAACRTGTHSCGFRSCCCSTASRWPLEQHVELWDSVTHACHQAPWGHLCCDRLAGSCLAFQCLRLLLLSFLGIHPGRLQNSHLQG